MTPPVPRPASTLVLLRHEGGSPLQTLMVVRAAQASFAGGALVFPGGTLDEGDRHLADEMANAFPHLAVGDIALRIAAIRETFEESGILLVRRKDGLPVPPEIVAGLIRMRQRGQAFDFRQMLHESGLHPLIDCLVPFARWITPQIRRKRFDTHFFLAAAPQAQSPVHDGSETTKAIWLSPQDAVDGAEDGRFKLVFPTRMNLLRIAGGSSPEEVMTTAHAQAVVPVMPDYVEIAGRACIQIPEAAGYGGSIFPVVDPPSM